MILDWLAQTPALLTAVVVAFAPGLAALYAVGMRGLALVAAAPLFSVASTAVIALGFGVVGIPWSPLAWAAASLAIVALAGGIGRLLGGRLRDAGPGNRKWLMPTAMAIGIAIGLWRLVSYIADPSGISQTNDAVFHMNALRFILETADASSLHVNAVIGAKSFYPAAWHGIVSLMVMSIGVSVPVAVNMLTLVIGGLIWTFGMVWLVKAVTGSDTVAAYAGILAAALQTFPLLMFQWGVLFPNALSTALIPAAIATVVTLPCWQGSTRRGATAVRSILLVTVALAAILLAQPAGILPWVAICGVWVSTRVLRRRTEWGIARVSGALVMLWAIVGVVWLALSAGTSGSHWAPFRGKFGALLDVLLNGQVMIPYAFGISVLMLVGLVIAVRTARFRWYAVVWAGISALYLFVASVGAPLVRDHILGAWYADPYRIASLAPIVVIPLAAVGLDGLVRVVARRLPRSSSDTPLLLSGIGIATALMIVLAVLRPVAMPAVTQGTYDRESRYVAASDAYLNPDEQALLEKLPQEVPVGARVLGNPSTGTGFGYFLSGVDVFPRTWSAPRTPQWEILGRDLRNATSVPEVCDALRTYGDPKYVLDFGLGEDGPGRYLMPGMTDFAGQAGFQFVGAVGEASLWRITACAQ